MLPFRPVPFPRWPEAGNLIPVGEYREDGTRVIRAGLPGIDPGTDVGLTVAGGMLRLEAGRQRQRRPGRRSDAGAALAGPAAGGRRFHQQQQLVRASRCLRGVTVRRLCHRAALKASREDLNRFDERRDLVFKPAQPLGNLGGAADGRR
jgi:hypothetical protein